MWEIYVPYKLQKMGTKQINYHTYKIIALNGEDSSLKCIKKNKLNKYAGLKKLLKICIRRWFHKTNIWLNM